MFQKLKDFFSGAEEIESLEGSAASRRHHANLVSSLSRESIEALSLAREMAGNVITSRGDVPAGRNNDLPTGRSNGSIADAMKQAQARAPGFDVKE